MRATFGERGHAPEDMLRSEVGHQDTRIGCIGPAGENLVRAGYTSPLRPTLKLALNAITHPRWLFDNALRTLRHHGMPYYENSTAERGMAVLRAHHPRKGSVPAGQAARGSRL